MGKRKATFAGHAWQMLRMALLWARKGGALRRKLMLDLHHALSHLRSLRAAGASPCGRIHYGELYRRGERELSFDETPTFRFHLKARRPNFFPCVNPPEVVDDDDGDCYYYQNDQDELAPECVQVKEEEDADGRSKCSMWEEQDGQEGIDVKAEEFIERFYQQMKLQRQISLLQYNEMLCRGMS